MGCMVTFGSFVPQAVASVSKTLTVQGAVKFVPIGNTALAEAGSARYRGVLEVAPAPKGGLSMVNELGFEDYLKGIAEVPGRWPEEALRAQAIAARTYVLWELARGRSAEGRQLGYDICATVACQVYRGLDNESGMSGAAWAAAVESTRAVAVTHDGKPILARYHSTSGGRTRHNEDVFTSEGPRPYLKSVESPLEDSSPLYRWTTRFPKAYMEQMLSGEKDVPLKGNFVDVRFVKYPDGSGKPNEVVVVGSAGETTVRAGTFSRVVSREAKERWPAEYPPANPALPGAKLPDAVPSSNLSFRIEGDAVIVDGSGWGHGVGMSQYGALGMAEAGSDAESILKHYYSGTRVEPVSEPDVVRVGIGTGAPKVVIEGSGEFRIEGADGKVLVERALGKYTVEPKSKGAVTLQLPAGGDSELTLTGPVLSRTAVGADENAVSISYTSSRPALVTFEVLRASDGNVVYSSEERVIDPGTATDTWTLTAGGGRRPPSGEYLLVVKARSPGGDDEVSLPFSVESPADETSNNGSAGSGLVPVTAAAVLAAVALAAAVTLIRRRRKQGQAAGSLKERDGMDQANSH